MEEDGYNRADRRRASVLTPGCSLRVCVPEIGKDVVPAAQSEGTESEPVDDETLDLIRGEKKEDMAQIDN